MTCMESLSTCVELCAGYRIRMCMESRVVCATSCVTMASLGNCLACSWLWLVGWESFVQDENTICYNTLKSVQINVPDKNGYSYLNVLRRFGETTQTAAAKNN